jgi:hypothetical protein
MPAYKGNQERGVKGWATDGMQDFPLVRDDTPQSVGRIYKSKYSATYGLGAYTGNADAMDGDPIVKGKTDTGNRNREADIWAADGGGPAQGLAQKLPKPAGAPRSKRMTTALGDS